MNKIEKVIDILQTCVDTCGQPEADMMQQAVDILSESEPEPTEFTKKLRTDLEEYLHFCKEMGAPKLTEMCKEALKACDIIDNQAAENIKLKLDIKVISECKIHCKNCNARIKEALKGE